MGRLRVIGPDGNLLPAYDHTSGYDASIQLDDQNKIRLPVVNSPVRYKTNYGDLEMNMHDDIADRLKYINNKTEYDIKVGKRCEGLQFRRALDMPVLNLLQNADSNAMALPLGTFTEEEQEYLRGDNLDLPEPEQTQFDEGTQSLQKTQAPFEKDEQPTELEFIDMDGGKYYKSILKRNVVSESGSNVVADTYFDLNGGRGQAVGDRSAESLYNQQMGSKTVSNVNMKQQNNFKAKQQLGLYQGIPTTQKERDQLFLQEFVQRDLDSRHYGGKAPTKKIIKP